MAISYDEAFLKAVARDGIDPQWRAIFDPQWLTETASKIFLQMENHWEANLSFPTGEVLQSQFGIDDVQVDSNGPGHWVPIFRARRIWEIMGGARDALQSYLSTPGGDAPEAITRVENILSEAWSLVSDVDPVDKLIRDPLESVDEAMQAAGKPIWCSTGFTALDNEIGGWQPGEIVIFSARPGVGKSFRLILQALAAWRSGRKTMIVTTELSASQMRRRTTAIASRTALFKFRRALISDFERDQIANSVAPLVDDNLLLYRGNFKTSIEHILAKAKLKGVEVLLIDGFYLMKMATADPRMPKNERIGQMLDMTKQHALDTNSVVGLATQLNRAPQGKGNGKEKPGDITLDRMAFSDNMGMVADYVFYLARISDKRMQMRPLKMREGSLTDPIEFSWDFETMDFGEVAVTREEFAGAPTADTPTQSWDPRTGERPPDDDDVALNEEPF